MRTITAEELGVVTAIPLPQRRDWRIGMIGYGGISSAHQSAYEKAGWNIVAVADPAEAAQARARETLPHARVYSDYGQLLEEVEVDAIALLTQPVLRLPVVQAAAKHGRPILIEKPLANTLEEAGRIVQVGEDHALPIAVSQNYRWAGSNFFARQLVEQGYIGEMHFASIEIFGTQDRDLYRHDFYSQCDDFLTVQWNTHLADLLQYWSGSVPQRRWTLTRRSPGQNFKSDNLLISAIDFGKGLTGHILHSELVRSGATGSRCRIDGSEGSLVFPMSGDHVEIYCAKLGNEPARLDLGALDLTPSMAGSMGDLLLSLEQNREPSVSARRNLATLNAVLSDQESSKQGGVWL
jgi:predicted dehydrogenase